MLGTDCSSWIGTFSKKSTQEWETVHSMLLSITNHRYPNGCNVVNDSLEVTHRSASEFVSSVCVCGSIILVLVVSVFCFIFVQSRLQLYFCPFCVCFVSVFLCLFHSFVYRNPKKNPFPFGGCCNSNCCCNRRISIRFRRIWC